MVDCYVPPEHLLPARSLAPSELWGNPTYRNPTHAIYNKAAVALGVCRGAIDNFIDLAKGKVPWGLSTTLKDQPVVQYRVVEARAKLMAAQTCREVVGAINNTAATTGCRMDSPLERPLRDAQQAANHTLISYRHSLVSAKRLPDWR